MLRHLTIAACCTSSLPAFADETPDPPSDSYRASTLAADAVATLAFAGARYTKGSQSGALATLGVGTYLFGAPLAHLAHGRRGTAAGSLTLRVVLPLVGLAFGSAGNPCPLDNDSCWSERDAHQALGVSLGMLAAMIIDTAWLARADDPPAPSIVPTVNATRDAIALGLTGRF